MRIAFIVSTFPKLSETFILSQITGLLDMGHDVKELFSHGDRFTSNTEYTRRRAAMLGCDEKKITILPVGLNIGKFKYTPRSLKTGEPVRLLTIGRLVEKKGHEYALKAVKALKDKGHNIRYTIAGDGPEKDRLIALSNSLGLSEQVEFLFEVNEREALELYSRSHIFVLPSVTSANQDREGQALVLQEAQACGMPVVSTLHNGIPEGVLDGVSAFLVPEKDHHRLAERLEYLIERPSTWANMGLAGRKFVESKYDIRKLNKELVSIYEEMLRA